VSQVYLRYEGSFRIAQRWAVADLAQELTIYPNLHEAKRHAVYLIRNRQLALEKRFSRIRGAGRAFESLREYQDGDDFGDICWTATARRGKLVTRLYELEKSQTIWIVLDTGRLMRARVASLSKLDHAVNAALALCQVALFTGDRVGLLSYARNIRQRIPAMRGHSQLRQFLEALAEIREDEWEADHLQAASQLMRDQKRRSLVVWITDLAETAMTPEVIEAVAKLMPRHLVLFVVIGQPDLQMAASRRPKNVSEMYEVSAAQEVIHRRELLLARLRERGALAVEADSGELAPLLVNSYLAIKQAPKRYPSRSTKSAAAMANFKFVARPVGETNASMVPATIRIGIEPSSNWTASDPARTRDSRRGRYPGNSSPEAMRNPAPPARKIAGSSRTPWGATNSQSFKLIPDRWHAMPITPINRPLKSSM